MHKPYHEQTLPHTHVSHHGVSLAPSPTAAEKLRAMLVELKKQHPGEDARVTTCFQTLLKMVGNVARAPGEGKYRSIRMSNPVILEKVLSLDGSVQFLQAVGFQVGCVC